MYTVYIEVINVHVIISSIFIHYRGFRKWWQSLPSNKKAYIWQTLKESRVKIMIGGGMVSGLLVGYYVTHLQVTPVTNRSRYVAFTPEQFMKIAEFEKEIVRIKHGIYYSNKLYCLVV